MLHFRICIKSNIKTISDIVEPETVNFMASGVICQKLESDFPGYCQQIAEVLSNIILQCIPSKDIILKSSCISNDVSIPIVNVNDENIISASIFT